MIEMLYAIFIFPLEFFMRGLIEFFFSITGSYGISVIILSIAVNTIMLPLNNLAEKYHEFDQKIQNKMKPEIDKINNYFKGRERHYYIKTIHRRFNYSHFSTLKASSGFLIQIPFFFAAFHFLTNYIPLNNEGFLILEDLSSPDRIINGINLLPFVMTFFSILSAYLYSKNSSKKDKVQSLMLSFIFLVFLYGEASALLIYWTFNNLFSLVRIRFASNLKNHRFNLIKFQLNNTNIYYVATPFLFLLAYFLLLLTINIDEVSIYSIYRPLIIAFISFSILFLALLGLVRDLKKTSLLFTIFTILFVFYGSIQELFGVTARVLIVIYIFIGIISVVYILQYHSKSNKALIILNRLALLIISISFIKIMMYVSNNTNLANVAQTYSVKDKSIVNTNIESLPDVYYIIPDAFARSDVLLSRYGYDNKEFIDTLKAKGFYYSENSRSNYSQTFLSLASSLNMKYINNLTDVVGKDSKDRRIPINMIQNSTVIRYLKDFGYNFINFSSGWGPTDRMSLADKNILSFSNEFEMQVVNNTLLGPFVKIFMNIQSKNILNVFENAPVIVLDNDSPTFVLAHLMSPHPPFIFDEHGQSINKGIYSMHGEDVWSQDDLYLGQLKFIEKKIVKLVEEIIDSANKRGVVIIVQSDHGVASSNKANLNQRLLNFSAIYFSNQKYKELYSELSPVNTFRVVFNNVFGEEFEILDDKSYFSESYERPYIFNKIIPPVNQLN
jgi:YidC/Oxa1 family membrane protein insertase